MSILTNLGSPSSHTRCCSTSTLCPCCHLHPSEAQVPLTEKIHNQTFLIQTFMTRWFFFYSFVFPFLFSTWKQIILWLNAGGNWGAKRNHWCQFCLFASWLRSEPWTHTWEEFRAGHLLLPQLVPLLVPVRHRTTMDLTSFEVALKLLSNRGAQILCFTRPGNPTELNHHHTEEENLV